MNTTEVLRCTLQTLKDVYNNNSVHNYTFLQFLDTKKNEGVKSGKLPGLLRFLIVVVAICRLRVYF